jgi:hypothetical protein
MATSLLMLGVSAGAATGTTGSVQAHSVVFLVTTAIVVACVVLHYEILSWLSRLMRVIHMPPRRRILLLIFSIMGAHVIEIWIYGAGYYALTLDVRHGQLVSLHTMGILDYVYYSAVCFTTLGLGDIAPVGAIRFMTGTEALNGFVLITWSGSFTFVEMQRFWKD